MQLMLNIGTLIFSILVIYHCIKWFKFQYYCRIGRRIYYYNASSVRTLLFNPRRKSYHALIGNNNNSKEKLLQESLKLSTLFSKPIYFYQADDTDWHDQLKVGVIVMAGYVD